MRYFDTHAHIGLITEDPIDQLSVGKEARQEGVQHLVTVSNNLIDFAQLLANRGHAVVVSAAAAGNAVAEATAILAEAGLRVAGSDALC